MSECDAVYKECDLCIALLVQYAQWFGHRIGIKEHVGDDWDDEWRNVVFIDLPTGQVSWHLHKDELVNFPGVEPYPGEWDGHTSAEKYERIRKFIYLGKAQ